MKKALTLLSLALLGQASAATLTVWTHFGENELVWLRDQAKTFEAKTQNKINIVSVPFDDLTTKFLQSAPKGQGPDLIVTQAHDRIGQMAAAGVIEPMDKYVTSRTDLDKTAVQAMTYKGKLFGIPMFAESVALIYNKKLVPQAPTTWNALLSAAQSAQKAGNLGFVMPLDNAYLTYGFTSAYGGYVFKNNGGTLNTKDIGLGNAGAVKAAGFINDLRYKYNLIPEGITGDAVKSAFTQGRAAMMISGPWDIDDIRKAGIDFGIAPFPTPPGASGKWSPFVGVQGTIMNAYSKNKAAAAQFAKAITTADAQISFNKAGGRIPVSLAARTKLKSNPVVAGFSRTISAGTPMPNIPEMGAVWGPWTNAVTQVSQKPGQNYSQILTKAVGEIKGNIK
ncbi:sugar ABC transporter substrate-binding protein [Deinococcus sp. PESE-13]